MNIEWIRNQNVTLYTKIMACTVLHTAYNDDIIARRWTIYIWQQKYKFYTQSTRSLLRIRDWVASILLIEHIHIHTANQRNQYIRSNSSSSVVWIRVCSTHRVLVLSVCSVHGFCCACVYVVRVNVISVVYVFVHACVDVCGDFVKWDFTHIQYSWCDKNAHSLSRSLQTTLYWSWRVRVNHSSSAQSNNHQLATSVCIIRFILFAVASCLHTR